MTRHGRTGPVNGLHLRAWHSRIQPRRDLDHARLVVAHVPDAAHREGDLAQLAPSHELTEETGGAVQGTAGRSVPEESAFVVRPVEVTHPAVMAGVRHNGESSAR